MPKLGLDKKPALYKGDVGCMETSDEHNAIVIVVPC